MKGEKNMMTRNESLIRKLAGNTFKGQQGFLIGLLFLVFSLSQSIFAMAEDVLPKALLPDLENYGFKLTKVVEMTQSDWMKSVANITEQFNIPGISPGMAGQLKEQFNFPLLSATGRYSKNDKERIAIDVYKFGNETNAQKWLNKQIEGNKELESQFKTSVIKAKLEKIKVNGKEAHYFIFGSSDPAINKNKEFYYETTVYWQSGIYFFQLKFYAQNPWPQAEAVNVANEIKS